MDTLGSLRGMNCVALLVKFTMVMVPVPRRMPSEKNSCGIEAGQRRIGQPQRGETRLNRRNETAVARVGAGHEGCGGQERACESLVTPDHRTHEGATRAHQL